MVIPFYAYEILKDRNSKMKVNMEAYVEYLTKLQYSNTNINL
jgi:hypothetical protein